MKQHPKPNRLRLLAIALVVAAGGSSNAAAQHSTTAQVIGSNTAAVGTASAAVGSSPTASAAVGTASAAVGTASEAVGTASAAVGTASAAVGTASAAVGTASAAVGTASEAVGTASAAVGTASEAVGSSPLTLGIRTNLLSWATLSPSLGVDLQWGTRWQATLDGSIGLASTHTHNGSGRYSRISSIGLQARRYFRATSPTATTTQQPQHNDAHQGAYLAVGVRHMHVDFKNHAAATALGREGTVNTAGIIVGYTLRLPARLSLDAALGAGYLHRYYNRYTWYAPQHRNRLVDTRNRGMLGITHAEISLVYHLNLK